MTEGWDWARVQHEPCPQCGFDPRATPPPHLGAALVEVGTAWERVLWTTGPEHLVRRPAPDSWCALELGAHVRDVVRVFRDRIALALAEDEPELGWWDHEAAAVDEGYAAQEPTAVGRAIDEAARALARDLDAIPPGATWRRAATRRGTERFTVEGMATFTLHEAVHHLADAEAALATTPG